MSILLEKSSLPFEAIDFKQLKVEEYIPSLKTAIETAKEEIKKLKETQVINFDTVINRLSEITEQVDFIALLFSNMDSADCTDEISAISQDFYSLVTKFSNDISLDAGVFKLIKEVWENKDKETLSAEDKIVLEKTYIDMVRNGALLNESDKDKMREIDEKLALLSVKFSENQRNSINAYTLYLEDDSRLKGLPDGALEAAKEKAKEKGYEKGFAFGLDFSSYYPLLQYCEDRELREEIFLASSKVAYKGEYDNCPNIKETLELRQKRAELLGYKNHADFILERRMAANAETVFNFSNEILEKSKEKALNEFNELKKLKLELSGEEDFQKWDYPFYAEILKKRTLDLDDEVLRPYFKLENVIDGVFKTAEKLYDLSFKEREDIAVYHEDVRVFEVSSNDTFVGLFYCDFFPRKTKRAGAWMTEFRSQGTYSKALKRPHVSIVCNFTKPTASKPSLLTLNEVLTLFHEFGHALHGLLSDVTHREIAGPSVYWDFVELPSQVLENWALEKECLELFATHYETGELLPDDLIAKIKQTNTFLSGLGTLRQLNFGMLDMMYHTTDPASIGSLTEFEQNIASDYDFFPKLEGVNKSCSFGHIFAGGYSAGYYSYKWAEVLDADAFAYFKENGIFNKEIASKFKDFILSRGGSEHPMELYKKFRGHEPQVDALLERAGLA